MDLTAGISSNIFFLLSDRSLNSNATLNEILSSLKETVLAAREELVGISKIIIVVDNILLQYLKQFLSCPHFPEPVHVAPCIF